MSRDQFNVTLDTVTREEWSAYLQLFDDASLYQTWDYASVIYPGQRSHHVVLFRGSEVAALAMVRVKIVPILGFGLANVWWGPLFKRKGHEQDISAIEAILKYLREEFVARRNLRLRIVPNISRENESSMLAALQRGGFKVARVLQDRTGLYWLISRDLRPILSKRFHKCGVNT